MKSLAPIIIFLALSNSVYACSCFGPDNFCEALDTIWDQPDVVVLAEKISDIHYGMQVKVIDPLSSGSESGDTLMVWGDHGFLCRVYTATWSVGDTIILGLHDTDFMGNTFPNTNFPPDLEQPGDHHISVCGVYYLDYLNGTVSGAIDGSQTTMPYRSFQTMVEECSLFTSIDETPSANVSVRQDLINEVLIIECANTDQILSLYDLSGRLLNTTQASGTITTIRTADLPKGVLIIHAINDQAVLSKKVLVL